VCARHSSPTNLSVVAVLAHIVVTYDAVYDALGESLASKHPEPRTREEAVSNHQILSFATSASAAAPEAAVGVAELDPIEGVSGTAARLTGTK
jgi:hypothetical protein